MFCRILIVTRVFCDGGNHVVMECATSATSPSGHRNTQVKLTKYLSQTVHHSTNQTTRKDALMLVEHFLCFPIIEQIDTPGPNPSE